MLLTASVIIIFVIAFIIIILVQNANTKKIISTNTQLVENHNKLLELNNQLKCEIETLQKQKKKLEEKLKQKTKDELSLLREQTRQHREYIESTSEMSDEELMEWLDHKMDETKLFTDSTLTLKTMATSLGLTQKRLGALFKNNEKYGSLGNYLNEKRFLLACRLLREKPHWTIEAVGTEAGFGGRRTFQTEVKRRLGITPLQYRQSQTLTSKKEE